ncbi:MAG: hypothetical protein A3G33_08120 [Omnitrophica bacterium RIFCSPLOWO2_12_FULL_44_17]|uniref:Uncharacterized protein n=1 Tax=Candidatus Danuiimicrobium aquiferis TaxID=1801832 RepID=A0A1G1KXY6_9BACT|nr:MAG: hypothetical protein A3B72_05820 [Omnitrophica bacterium RIFCSPHIGHO2_02_FULL_45_28]OGW92335.1 MAG: hypothetical protein A3E74_09375 [Omnitrophica bacterium RIFCSPHIGHO2_12_FULL_44_12]OGW97768.1 MAG: hypothetical protein A3G33_08120 [Omnitrophica bacterium RIFCSPLOWO2_12_FULL_44_17]OGX04980.1 MAG: hypothetical protein A3J12_02090 [Omnitrophica bacterium RIFCSPLOWO2_02_FULL_44_11]
MDTNFDNELEEAIDESVNEIDLVKILEGIKLRNEIYETPEEKTKDPYARVIQEMICSLIQFNIEFTRTVITKLKNRAQI